VEKGAVFSVVVIGGPGSAIEAEVIRPRGSGLEVKRERSGRSRLVVETGTGSIDIEGLRGDQRLRTDTGRITVRECRGEIRAETDTGGIVLSEFRGRLDLRSDTGSLEGRSVVLTADCQLTTDTGSIDFELEHGLKGWPSSWPRTRACCGSARRRAASVWPWAAVR